MSDGADRDTAAGDFEPRDADLQALAHARHELRTPINALIGYSEMLLEDAEEVPEVQAPLQEIKVLSRHLQDAVSDLLQARKLESGTLAQVWEHATHELQAPALRMVESVQRLRVLAESDGLESLAPDVDRLHEAARRFKDLLLSHLGHQPELKTAPAVQSTQYSVHNESATLQAAEDAPDMSEFSGHVLVVDDNQFNREILARGLLKQKRHFALAAHGKQALEMLASRAFDVVLLDIMMPEMDGFETLAHIKADPALKHTPVIMISALDQIDSVVRCIEMGAEDYLPKPFDPVLLRARVGACLEKKRLRDQELEYLRNVALVTEAATAVEAGAFDPNALGDVAGRTDSLGRLARVFQSMAREVRAREERLQKQVQDLRIEIDTSRKAKQVAEITETDYFQELQKRAQELKQRRG